MLTVQTQKSEPRVESTSLRRLMVTCLLPVSLLLLSAPIAQSFNPKIPVRATKVSKSELVTQVEYRKAALKTVERLAEEMRRTDGKAHITSKELKELRGAL